MFYNFLEVIFIIFLVYWWFLGEIWNILDIKIVKKWFYIKEYMGNGLIVLNREENGYKSLRGFRNLKNN